LPNFFPLAAIATCIEQLPAESNNAVVMDNVSMQWEYANSYYLAEGFDMLGEEHY
jgi:hypothetical protein